MHSLCLVVGDDPERQLARFSTEIEMPRHKEFLDGEEIADMAEQYEVAATDLDALAVRMPEWTDAEGGVENGRLFKWSTANPDGRFDWYKIGGRFSGYLRLTNPAKPSGFRRMLGAKDNDTADQARKSEIRVDLVLSDPPGAILLGDTWHEGDITLEAPAGDAWKQRFAELFKTVPPDALLTVIDVHT